MLLFLVMESFAIHHPLTLKVCGTWKKQRFELRVGDSLFYSDYTPLTPDGQVYTVWTVGDGRGGQRSLAFKLQSPDGYKVYFARALLFDSFGTEKHEQALALSTRLKTLKDNPDTTKAELDAARAALLECDHSDRDDHSDNRLQLRFFLTQQSESCT